MKTLGSFPDDFIWGSATSGHQVEGQNQHSNWWHWELKTETQPHSGRAVDYWNRFEEDHALMAEMGLQAFRVGIEWARIEPRQGEFDMEAVARYLEIFDSLNKHGIKICLTLHHWVVPQWAAEKGDWRNPNMVAWFLEYVRFAVEQFAAYPFQWVTLNEPMVPALAGYLSADFPPGRHNYFEFRKVVRNMLQAHAGAYQLIHQQDPQAMVGVAMAYPDLQAWGSTGLAGAYERFIAGLAKRFIYQAWDDSVKTGKIHPLFGRGEIAGLKDSVDFCGINYYFRMTLRFSFKHARSLFIDQNATPEGIEKNDFGWQIWPKGIRTTISKVWHQFAKPIVITENGIADRNDEKRAHYITSHLKQISLCLEDGIPVQGYYHWSFIDNFEWNEGFDMAFGLVAVDPEDPNLTRKPRKSASIYSKIIRENGRDLNPVL
ncbi:glycoside hydrolase family 1 protein [Kiritimatiellota bacterium B12222]|nr:glycoside hydrolase family 1 protein [Kiritimatiellota bacterium B12222]